MRVDSLRVKNFRSVQELDWTLEGSFCCLVGVGDAGKSTILLAMEKALSPRWNEQFHDVDFYGANTSKPIEIEVDIGDLPPALLSDEVFGLWIRSQGEGEHDEPAKVENAVITVRLVVEDSLEPVWTIVNDREPDGRRLSNRERQRFHMLRLGEGEARHLAWGRGSALAELGSEGGEVQASLSEATRAARNSVDPKKLKKLSGVAQKAEGLLNNFGLQFRNGLAPHLDSTQSWGGLALHDGTVPLKNAGAGTVRLAALGLQLELAKAGGVTLIDEVEHGLDPHRLRRLLGALREASKSGTVIVTTHSPVAVQEVGVEDLKVLVPGAKHEVRTPSANLHVIVREEPEALLGQSALVCEGTTEVGFARGLSDVWANQGQGLANGGTSLVDAKSCSNVVARAEQLKPLGMRVAVFADQDKPLAKGCDELKAQGIRPFLWDAGLSIENAVFQDLAPKGIIAVLQAIKDVKPEKFAEGLRSRKVDLPDDWESDTSWLDSKTREQLGKAAKARSWIKETSLARRVGEAVAQHLPESSESLQDFLGPMKSWVSGNDDPC